MATNQDRLAGPSALGSQLWIVWACAALLPVGMLFDFWGNLAVAWIAVSLATGFVAFSSVRDRQRCCAVTTGYAATWLGILFCGWAEDPEQPERFDTGDKFTTTGFPIPAVRRLVHNYPEPAPGENPVGGSSWPQPCFGLDLDWVVFNVNLALLIGAAWWVTRRLGPRQLRVLQVVSGVTGTVAGWFAMRMFVDGCAYSIVMLDLEMFSPK